MIKPMLASPMSKAEITDWSDWSIEEKFDGHRLVVHVQHGIVHAYARPRGDGRMIERDLPPHLQAEFAMLANGIYDGELLSGDTGTDVSRTDLAHERTFVAFDLLESGGESLLYRTLDVRRVLLERALDLPLSFIRSSIVRNVTSKADVTRFVKAVWDRDGEGAILKLRRSTYQVGKRSKDWVKIKRVTHAILTVVGFEKSRGTVMGRGAFAVVKLRDDDGNETTCKTKNDYELAKFNQQAGTIEGTLDHVLRSHPALGRKLVIEFPRRTRTGGYQGPVIWDRWDNE